MKFINRDICKYCEGRGYIVFKRKYEDINNYQSFFGALNMKNPKIPYLMGLFTTLSVLCFLGRLNDFVQKLHFYFPTSKKFNG